MRFVILGGGLTGQAVARRALREGCEVVATTRSAERAQTLRAMGVTPLVAPTLSAEVIEGHVDAETRVLVTMPPDGVTDRATATGLRAAAIAYVSSTGVYGEASGRVDEETPAACGSPRAVARLDAERVWSDVGASVVRAPAIYGPGRGIHLRLARGELRLGDEGTNKISRVHVDDLAAALFTLLARGKRGALYVAGDAEPAPYAEVVRWVASRLGIQVGRSAPGEILDETLRHDRRVDSSRMRADLGLALQYPTYREGFAQCIEADREALSRAMAAHDRSPTML